TGGWSATTRWRIPSTPACWRGRSPRDRGRHEPAARRGERAVGPAGQSAAHAADHAGRHHRGRRGHRDGLGGRGGAGAGGRAHPEPGVQPRRGPLGGGDPGGGGAPAGGAGAQARVAERIQSLGSNLVVVRSGAATQGAARLGRGTRVTITQDDARAIQAEIPSVVASAPMVRGSLRAEYANFNTATTLYGVPPEYLDVREWNVRF